MCGVKTFQSGLAELSHRARADACKQLHEHGYDLPSSCSLRYGPR